MVTFFISIVFLFLFFSFYHVKLTTLCYCFFKVVRFDFTLSPQFSNWLFSYRILISTKRFLINYLCLYRISFIILCHDLNLRIGFKKCYIFLFIGFTDNGLLTWCSGRSCLLIHSKIILFLLYLLY